MPAESIKKSLATARQAMHEASVFIATYFEGEEDNKLKHWSNKGIYYTEKTMVDLIKESGLVQVRLNVLYTGAQTFIFLRKLF